MSANTLTISGKTVIGTPGHDTIVGTQLADHLFGAGSDDMLSGLGGSDWLGGGPGNDQLDGGDGIDTASYADASTGVTVNLLTGRADGGGGSDTLMHIENVTGSNFGDSVIGNAGGAGLHHETQLPLPLGLSSLEAMASAAKARQRLARNCMVSRTCASMVSTARRSQASARCRHCSRVLDGMAQRASLLVLRAGARIAAAGARKGSNWRYLNLGVTIPCRNTERTPVQQLRVREPPGSQPPRRQVVVAHPVVLAPTAADGLEHRVGNQHDLTHRPGGLDPVSSSALPARPPHPSCRMRARIWRSVRSRHAGAAPPSRYRSQVIRRNHDGKALNGSSRASAGVGRGSLP